MKKIFAIVLVLLTSGTLAYASPISQQWIKTYGGSDTDQINCIQQTTDGGYIAAGHTYSFLTTGIWVLKLDSNGEVAWQKQYAYGPWINTAYSIKQTIDNGYILAGFVGSMDSVTGWILKLDGNGNILWEKTYSPVIEFNSIQQTTDGGYIVVGDYGSPFDDMDMIMLKLDGMGNVLWSRSYDITNYDETSWVQQTSDGGYILTGSFSSLSPTDYYDPCVLKLNSTGDIIWQKSFDEILHFNEISHTLDGGYLFTGRGDGTSGAWILELDTNGEVMWYKTFIGAESAMSIHQTMDGGYSILGTTEAFGAGGHDIWILKLDSSGSVVGQKTFGGSAHDFGIYYETTMDGGYIIASNTESFGAGDYDLMILKLDSNGEIPGCDIIGTSNVLASDTPLTVRDTNASVESPAITVNETDTIPQDTSAEKSIVCYYEDPNDIDGDGIENNPEGLLTSSMYDASFLADVDNCSELPNGPYLGTCTKGNLGSTCIANEACGVDGICSMNQEDSYPPQGNGIGDACDCEGNFDCDGDCDGTDAATFKVDFGRSEFNNLCEDGDPCNGDFDCDNDCDGTDAALFKFDFGRSSFNAPCPTCVQGIVWCTYP